MKAPRVKITPEVLEKGKSEKGAWNKEQLIALGVPWPLTKGWQQRLLGTEVPRFKVREFYALKDRHLNKGRRVSIEEWLTQKTQIPLI